MNFGIGSPSGCRFKSVALKLARCQFIAAIQIRASERNIKVNGFFVRRERKRYGLSNTCKGTIADEPVVIIDDTLNSATSVEKVRVAVV
jgi:hypothetical protein